MGRVRPRAYAGSSGRLDEIDHRAGNRTHSRRRHRRRRRRRIDRRGRARRRDGRHRARHRRLGASPSDSFRDADGSRGIVLRDGDAHPVATQHLAHGACLGVTEAMADQTPRLFLIDGSSYIFRAFFAVPSLNHSTGLPTNAIFGFTNILLKFLKQHHPEYITVALDAGRETFRNELFPGYKGNRPEAPADLIPQFPYFRRVLDALNIPLLELPGYEADDIIATLCRTLADQGCELVVVSSDKDLMQLVTEDIKLLDSAKDQWIGAAEVKIKFGVEPYRVVEVMGLMGDAVDAIPGVKGIGEKTASALIQEFGALENLFNRLDEVDAMHLRGASRVRKIL